MTNELNLQLDAASDNSVNFKLKPEITEREKMEDDWI